MDANVKSMICEVVEEYLAENLPGLLEVAKNRQAQVQLPVSKEGGSKSIIERPGFYTLGPRKE